MSGHDDGSGGTGDAGDDVRRARRIPGPRSAPDDLALGSVPRPVLPSDLTDLADLTDVGDLHVPEDGPEAEAKAEADPEAEAGPEAEAKADPKADPESEAGPEAEAEVVPRPRRRPEPPRSCCRPSPYR